MAKVETKQTSMLTLVLAYLALMILLAATAALSLVPMGPGNGEWANDLVALGIAVLKAALVVFVFMELGRAPKTAKMWVIGGITFFAIMATITFDYFTRPWDFKTKSWYSGDVQGRVLGSSGDRGGPYTQSESVGRGQKGVSLK